MSKDSLNLQDRPTAPESAAVQVVSPVGLMALAICVAAGGLLAALTKGPFGFVLGLAVGLYLLFALKVANQWEKGAVLRFGNYRGLRGPGLFLIIPVVETVTRFVDQRVRVTDVSAEVALTKDTVPVNVDAIVFWVVWDAEKALLEVQDFYNAIALCAQTGLLESIGRHELAEMITQRDKLGHELQKFLDEKTSPWGITIQSVEIRDVRIPQDLQDAMSRQAQAERERQARIILGTAETEIAAKFEMASVVYRDNPTALHLRAMNMLYEAIKEKGSMVIVPSSAVETMGLGGMLGTTALSQPRLNGGGGNVPEAV